MSFRSTRRRNQRKAAEEEVLLAEEKWLVDALQKIKDQRKALREEKEHLEKIREQLLKESKSNKELEAGQAFKTIMAKIEESTKKEHTWIITNHNKY